MTYTAPVVMTTYKATSTIQMGSNKNGGAQDGAETFTNNPAYEGDE